MARSTTEKVADTVGKTMNNAIDAATGGPGMDDLRSQISTLRRDIEAIGRTLADMGRSREQEVVRQVKAGAAELKSMGGEKLAEARDRANDLLADVDDYARHKPMTALAIAAGIGMFLGLMMRRD